MSTRPPGRCPSPSAAAPITPGSTEVPVLIGGKEGSNVKEGTMTVEAGAAGPRVGLAVDAALNLKTGGICLIVGAVVFTIWRLLHGDTPAADAEAALNFVQNRPLYPTVHVFAVLAGLIVVIGLLALARSFDRPGSWFGSSPGSTRTTSARTSPYWISSQ